MHWMNRASLIKEIDGSKLPGSKKIVFRAGTVNSFKKGLAMSLQSKIDNFEGAMDATRLGELFRLGKTAYYRVEASKQGITVTHRPGQMTGLDTNPPSLSEYFPDFDFWDEKIEWHRCPDNLVEGIAYIENLIAKGPKIDKKNDLFGIHVEGTYVGRADPRSCLRFRLRFSVPFSMILKPGGIRQLGSRLKNRRLQRVAKYEIPDIGIGVVFDFGDRRVWNPTFAADSRNLVPEINKQFNFRIDNFLKLPRDITGALKLIKLMFKDVPASIDGRLAIAVTIGKEIRLTRGLQEAIIPLPKSRRSRPVSFEINLSAFEKLVGQETYLGYENPDPARKAQGMLYLKDRHGEHVEMLPKNETVIMRGLESRRDLHAAVSVYGGRDHSDHCGVGAPDLQHRRHGPQVWH